MSKAERQEFQITSVPDPIWREVLESYGFTYLRDIRRWVRTCGPEEVSAMETLLKQRSIPYQKIASRAVGRLVRWPKLSDELAAPDADEQLRCNVCGRYVERTHLYVECDDADSPEYPDPVRFRVCPECVRDKIDPHPRLYMRLE